MQEQFPGNYPSPGQPIDELALAEIKGAILAKLRLAIGKDAGMATRRDWYKAAALALRDRIVHRWLTAEKESYDAGSKRVYYLSLEFLIGRLFTDALNNMGLLPVFEAALGDLGVDAHALAALALPPSDFSMDRLEFYGRLSFLKGGLACADAITTVSPAYAAEIQTESQGCGLDGLLRQRRADLSGILNGIDTAIWDPGSDPLIAANYDAAALDAKGANKAALQQRMALRVDGEVPLLGMVGRLTHQKGIDLVLAAADDLVRLPAQLVVLGKGDRDHEHALKALAARYPGQVAVAAGFNEELAHLIEAGADVFLMPSRFEPCGLNQMYSQRYGTPPVVHATGGLSDTVADGETGFHFDRPERAALLAAVRRALAARREPGRWRAIQRAGMARDFSWTEPARRYADLYLRLARRQTALG